MNTSNENIEVIRGQLDDEQLAALTVAVCGLNAAAKATAAPQTNILNQEKPLPPWQHGYALRHKSNEKIGLNFGLPKAGW